ncbi:helix-turn-helix transcriptional regulator [Amycolatopsis sp. H20-H5]|uniref:helix-turn-helix transcriptional regulator n=1 Tax=Amycolatopsis sp. H20-H5 TaxID=3046309 RepID=UPI002DBBDEBF|nr:helix-turn-helix transcriptional regulator [Amycolatopsis sp. H20-H5]MEC3982589.1 helix-turn-helix transcriptional regulator [Amycolatopsis sp. H20-H5]
MAPDDIRRIKPANEREVPAKVDIEEVNAWRRSELAGFLKKARGRARPEVAGIEVGARRRTSGLRREEVAALAEVSTIWYTWLEQGRDVQASGRLLSALATALQLNQSEREYLRYLGRITQPRIVDLASPQTNLRQLLAQLPVPGILVDHHWRIIGRNSGADALLWNGDEGQGDNILRSIFLNPTVRELIPDWADLARSAVSVFRMTYARNIDDLELYWFIKRLRAESAEFTALWDEQIVEAGPRCVKAVRHWSAGLMRFEFVILRTFDDGDIMLFSLVPADADSAAAWKRLHEGRAERRGLRLKELAGGA